MNLASDPILAFQDHLRNTGYSESSILSFSTTLKRFLKWLYKETIEIQKVNYGDVINYIKSLQKKQLSQRTIQGTVKTIHRFYAFLIYSKRYKKHNPAEKIKIHGINRKKTLDVLSNSELRKIYQDYNGSGITFMRNKCLLSLVIFQGIGTSELINLKVSNVDLENGLVIVPKRKRHNKRILNLSEEQVTLFHEYIFHIRTAIIERKKINTDLLFISNGSGNKMLNSIQSLIRFLKKGHPKIRNINHLRASVITFWTKKYNLRKVQYLAGHRYISSTENYELNNINDLKNSIISLHPF